MHIETKFKDFIPVSNVGEMPRQPDMKGAVVIKTGFQNDLLNPDTSGRLYDNWISIDPETQLEMVKTIQNGTKLKKVKGDMVFGSENTTRLVIVEQTDTAKEQLATLIQASEGLFRKVVEKFMTRHQIPYATETVNNLLSPARIGGMLAVYQFDLKFQNKFTTYAHDVAYSKLVTYWFEKEDEYSLSSSPLRNAQNIRRFIGEYRKLNGMRPDIQTIAENLRIKPITVMEMLLLLHQPVELDQPVNSEESDSDTIGDLLANPQSELDETVHRVTHNQDVEMTITILRSWIEKNNLITDPKERGYANRNVEIIRLMYNGLSYEEIGQRLNIKRQRVEQLLPQARSEFQQSAIEYNAELSWPWISKPLKLPRKNQS